MTDEQIRLECLKIAVSASGQPEKINFAQQLYAWVTTGPVVQVPARPKKN